MQDNLTFSEGSCGVIDSPSTPPPPPLPSFSRSEGGILCFRVLLGLPLPPPSLWMVSIVRVLVAAAMTTLVRGLLYRSAQTVIAGIEVKKKKRKESGGEWWWW